MMSFVVTLNVSVLCAKFLQYQGTVNKITKRLSDTIVNSVTEAKMLSNYMFSFMMKIAYGGRDPERRELPDDGSAGVDRISVSQNDRKEMLSHEP